MSALPVEWLLPKRPGWKQKPFFSLMKERIVLNKGLQETRLLSLSYGRIVEKDISDNSGLLPASFEGYNIVEPNDIVMRLTDLQNDQRSLRTGFVGERGIITSAYVTVTPSPEFEPRFAHYLLHGYDLAKVFYGMGAGLRQSMKYADLKRMPLVVPPLREQQEVANFLDEQTARIDTLIAGKERLVFVLKEWHSSELETLCCGSDKASELTGNVWITKIPKGWKLVRLKHLVRRIEQGWSPECEARLTDEGEWGILKAGAANHGIYTGNEEHKTLPSHLTPLPSLEVKAGDVLITRASGSADLVGSFAYVYSTRPKLMLSDKNFRLVFSDNSQLQPELLAWTCNTHPVREQIKQYVSGADGLAKNIGSSSLREIWLPVPPLHEQNELVTAIRALGQQHEVFQEHLKKHIERLREYRTSLISAAVTGQVDINNFQLEAA